MRHQDWQLIDHMRGSASRGVYIAACLHRHLNASANANCPPVS
jgi:hypothetical protein